MIPCLSNLQLVIVLTAVMAVFKGNTSYHFGVGFMHKGIRSAVNKAEFFSICNAVGCRF
jgi:hypothetical protein